MMHKRVLTNLHPQFCFALLDIFFSSAYMTWSHFVQCYGVFFFSDEKRKQRCIMFLYAYLGLGSTFATIKY